MNGVFFLRRRRFLSIFLFYNFRLWIGNPIAFSSNRLACFLAASLSIGKQWGDAQCWSSFARYLANTNKPRSQEHYHLIGRVMSRAGQNP